MDYLNSRYLSSARISEILELDPASFSGGPGRVDEDIVVDPVFAKNLSAVLRDWIWDTGGDVSNAESLFRWTMKRPIDPVRHDGVTYCSVEEPGSGVVAFVPSSGGGVIIGAYTGMDLAVNPAWQGKGIGRVLVAERFLRDGSLPSWDTDKPGFSPAGKACHDSAFRSLRHYAEERLRADRLSDAERFKGERHWSPDRPAPKELAHLGVADVEIQYHDEIVRLSHSQVEIAVAGNVMEMLQPLDGVESVISGRPAIIYRSQEAELHLTPDEFGRLVSRTLSPEEFSAICDHCGAIWETSSHFYDPETGIAHPSRPDPMSEGFSLCA